MAGRGLEKLQSLVTIETSAPVISMEKTFNDAGSGPLHVGPAVCAYTLDTVGGAGTLQGACAWGDADGDKITTDYVDKVSTSGALD